MSRIAVSLCLFALLLCSVGCQVCPRPCQYSSLDFRVAAFVDRHNDYRGSHPDYRAGSVFVGVPGTHQMAGDFFMNAGDFGTTSPVVAARRDGGVFGASPDIITAPPRPLDPDIFTPGGNVPGIQQLIDQQRNLPGTPIIPPAIPRVAPLPFDNTPSDTIPFSPSDAIPPLPNSTVPSLPNGGFQPLQSPFPTLMDTEPPITLEELQRLDPSVHDFQIISIEDAAVGMR